jgi:hypothetical protein
MYLDSSGDIEARHFRLGARNRTATPLNCPSPKPLGQDASIRRGRVNRLEKHELDSRLSNSEDSVLNT